MRQGRVAAPQPHLYPRLVGRPQLHIAGKTQGRRGGAGSSLLSVCHTSPQLGALQQHGNAQLPAQGTEESWLCVVPYWYQRTVGFPFAPPPPQAVPPFSPGLHLMETAEYLLWAGMEVALHHPCVNHMFLSETSTRADRAPSTSQLCTNWPPSPQDTATRLSQEQKAPTHDLVPACGRNRVPVQGGGRLVAKNTKNKEAPSSLSPRWPVFHCHLHLQDGLCHITQHRDRECNPDHPDPPQMRTLPSSALPTLNLCTHILPTHLYFLEGPSSLL